MSPAKPRVAIGEYYRTKPRWQRTRCVAYDAPPYDGRKLATLAPNTVVGPVENHLSTDDFVTICVRGWWINIWAAKDMRRPQITYPYGCKFARRVPDWEVRHWRSRGWRE